MTSDFVNLFEWVQTVTPEMLPETIVIRPGETVCTPGVWLDAIQKAALAGPDGPRARYGALQSELRWLMNRINELEQQR